MAMRRAAAYPPPNSPPRKAFGLAVRVRSGLRSIIWGAVDQGKRGAAAGAAHQGSTLDHGAPGPDLRQREERLAGSGESLERDASAKRGGFVLQIEAVGQLSHVIEHQGKLDHRPVAILPAGERSPEKDLGIGDPCRAGQELVQSEHDVQGRFGLTPCAAPFSRADDRPEGVLSRSISRASVESSDFSLD